MSLVNYIAALQQVLTAQLDTSSRRGMENLVGLIKPGVHVVQGLPSAFHLCLKKQLFENNLEGQLTRLSNTIWKCKVGIASI